MPMMKQMSLGNNGFDLAPPSGGEGRSDRVDSTVAIPVIQRTNPPGW